jgi:hypothetical protein
LVAAPAQAYFDIPIPFSKFFQLNSTDGSKLFIDDALVADLRSGGSKTQKWPLIGPKRFKITVQYFKVRKHVCCAPEASNPCQRYTLPRKVAMCSKLRCQHTLGPHCSMCECVLQGAIPSGTGLVVSWGDLRQLYPNPIASSELKLKPCSAAVPAPSPTPGHNGHREHQPSHPSSICLVPSTPLSGMLRRCVGLISRRRC